MTHVRATRTGRWSAPGQGRDEEGPWLITAALPGRNAVSDTWKAQPRTTVPPDLARTAYYQLLGRCP
jgi:hypothetical protein